MADFLTTLAKRTLNLIQVVQPAISSMFAPAQMMAADFCFHSTPAFEPPEVGEKQEERPDSLTQRTTPPFSVSNPVQMKSAQPADWLTAPPHLSLLSSELGLPTHAGTGESIAQNTPSVSDLREEIAVSSAAAPRTQLDAIAPTQSSEESALTSVKPLVNTIEEQQQPTDGREKGKKSIASPLDDPTNKILPIQVRQDIQAATPDPQQILPSGGIAESQGSLHYEHRIDAPENVTGSSSQVLSELEKPRAATPHLPVGYFETIYAIALTQPSEESALTPVKPLVNTIEEQQQPTDGREKGKGEKGEKSIASSHDDSINKILSIQARQDIQVASPNLPQFPVSGGSHPQGNVARPMLPEGNTSMPSSSEHHTNKILSIQAGQNIEVTTPDSQQPTVSEANHPQGDAARPMLSKGDITENQALPSREHRIDAPQTVTSWSSPIVSEPEKPRAATPHLPVGHFEAIAPTQPSEESSPTRVKPLVNTIEEQQQPTDGREKAKEEWEKEEKSVARPLHEHIQIATPNFQPFPVSGATYPQGNAVQPMLPEGGITESQTPPHQEPSIDAPATITGSSSQVVSEQKKPRVATPHLPVGHFEAIAPTQPSEESALTPLKPLVNAIEKQQQQTDEREKEKGEGQKGEKLMPSPLEHDTNKILSIQAGQNIEVASPNLQHSPVSGATHPQGNAVQQMLPEGGITESQAPLHYEHRIDAPENFTSWSSQQVVSEPEKPRAATPHLPVGHFEAIAPHLSESSQIPVLPQVNRIDLGQQQRNNNGGLEPDRLKFDKNLISSSSHSPDTLIERSARSFDRESSAAEVCDFQVSEVTVPSRQTPKPQMPSYFDAQQDIRTSSKQQAENRELAPRLIAKVENSNTEIQPFPMSDRHLLNEVEKLVLETPFQINSLVHRVDADELALVRPLLGSTVLVPDTRFKLSRAEEQNLWRQQLRHTEMRSSASRRLEPRNGREAAVAAKDSTPTIQVTISRIEVRASKSPELSRTRTVRSRPALSLDDYLKQRNGRDR